MCNKTYVEFEKYRDFKHNGYRIDTSVAYDKQDPTSKRNYQGISASFDFMPEWKYELNGKSDVTFGVRTSAVIREVFSKTKNGLSHGTHGSINLTGVVDYNFDLTKDVRGYVGMGAVFYINSKNIKYEEKKSD